MTDTKILNRVSALLAQAEGTDNEHERDAFITKAQSLATTFAIDLEVARQHQRDKNKREEPVVETVYLFGSYSDYNKSSGAMNRPAYVSLFLGIARANDVTCNIAHNSTYVVAFGFPSDIEVCKALYASLSIQMADACNRAIKADEHKKPENQYWSPARYKKVKVESKYSWTGWEYDEEYVPGHYRSDARVFRKAFYQGFYSKIEMRLMDAKREAEKAQRDRQVTIIDEQGVEESTSVALVLVTKKEAIRSLYKQRSNARGSWKGGRSSGPSSHGAYNAGSAAGSRAQIGARGAISGARGSLAS